MGMAEHKSLAQRPGGCTSRNTAGPSRTLLSHEQQGLPLAVSFHIIPELCWLKQQPWHCQDLSHRQQEGSSSLDGQEGLNARALGLS